MRFSESELKRALKRAKSSKENEVIFNILNFIHVIHLNQQNFIEESFNSEFCGDLPMIFRKEAGRVIGLVTAVIDGREYQYVFNDQGFESLDELLGQI